LKKSKVALEMRQEWKFEVNRDRDSEGMKRKFEVRNAENRMKRGMKSTRYIE